MGEEAPEPLYCEFCKHEIVAGEQFIEFFRHGGLEKHPNRGYVKGHTSDYYIAREYEYIHLTHLLPGASN